MKTKEEVLDFLQQNNCNQELINKVKDSDGYDKIARSYERNGIESTELALQHEKAKGGWDVYNIAWSYKENGVEFTELALQHEKAENGYHAFWIAKSYEEYGVKFTKLVLQQKQVKNGHDVYHTDKQKIILKILFDKFF